MNFDLIDMFPAYVDAIDMTSACRPPDMSINSDFIDTFSPHVDAINISATIVWSR